MIRIKRFEHSDIDDVMAFEKENCVHIGRTHEEFITHVNHLIAQRNNLQLQQTRAKVAEDFAWENLYRKLFDKIDSARVNKR